MSQTAVIPSASHPKTNEVVFDLVKGCLRAGGRILDFGAGRGHMCQRLGGVAEAMGLDPAGILFPVDIESEAFRYEKLQCQRIAPDSAIPFEARCFDAIYAIEVIEHTRRPYDFLAECYRVLRPGGLLVFSLPNPSHMAARWSHFCTGFFTLFPPPSTDPKKAGRVAGHIMPLSFPYLHYGCAVAGFEGIETRVDRRKLGAAITARVLAPLLWWSTRKMLRGMQKGDGELYAENAHVVRAMNGFDLLSARSLIVLARKPLVETAREAGHAP